MLERRESQSFECGDSSESRAFPLDLSALLRSTDTTADLSCVRRDRVEGKLFIRSRGESESESRGRFPAGFVLIE